LAAASLPVPSTPLTRSSNAAHPFECWWTQPFFDLLLLRIPSSSWERLLTDAPHPLPCLLGSLPHPWLHRQTPSLLYLDYLRPGRLAASSAPFFQFFFATPGCTVPCAKPRVQLLLFLGALVGPVSLRLLRCLFVVFIVSGNRHFHFAASPCPFFACLFLVSQWVHRSFFYRVFFCVLPAPSRARGMTPPSLLCSVPPSMLDHPCTSSPLPNSFTPPRSLNHRLPQDATVPGLCSLPLTHISSFRCCFFSFGPFVYLEYPNGAPISFVAFQFIGLPRSLCVEFCWFGRRFFSQFCPPLILPVLLFPP